MQSRTLGEMNALREGMDTARAYLKWTVFRAICDGNTGTALAMVESDPQLRPHLDAFRKAAVESMTTAPGSAGPLSAARPYGAAFLRPAPPRSAPRRPPAPPPR